jgi:FtsP/CotA-like multicopper oxidase with cupredoxin domain
MQNAQLNGGGGHAADNILINGTNKSPDGTKGDYSTVTLEPGKTHRLRLVNTGIDAQLRATLDGHQFQVIATDLVPVKPYFTDYVQLGIGQRYDVLITANLTDTGNFWFRAEADPNCQSGNTLKAKAIFTYKGTPVADPTTPSSTNTPTSCSNVGATPHLVLPVPSNKFIDQVKELDVNFGQTTLETNNKSIVLWNINGTAMWIDPGKPTIEYVAEKNNTFPHDYQVIEIPKTSEVSFPPGHDLKA